MIRNSVTLLQYAGYLLVVGLASAFYNAASGTAGFNKHGVSGLIACGGSAVLIFLCGWLAGKGKEWAGWAGLALCFMLLTYGGSTLFTQLRDLDRNAGELIAKRAKDFNETLTTEEARNAIRYKAGIFGALFVFSLLTFIKLGTSLRRSKTV